MLTVVVAKLGKHAFEAVVRDGINEGSHLIPGIPPSSGVTEDEAIRKAKAHLEHWEGPIDIDRREDPWLTQE